MSDPVIRARAIRLDDAALRRIFAMESMQSPGRSVDHRPKGLPESPSVRRSGGRAVAGASVRHRHSAKCAAAAFFGAAAILLETADFSASRGGLVGSLHSAHAVPRAEESQMQAFDRSFVAAGVLGGVVGLGIASATPAAAADAEIVAWGYNGSGQTNAPTGAFRAVAVGGHFYTGYSLGVRADGSIVHWGSGVASGVPTGSFTDVAGCLFSACAVRADGTLQWWGINEHGLANIPSGLFVEVDGSLINFAARRPDGRWTLWGFDGQGQVSNAPTSPLEELKVGPTYSLARTQTGELILWGNPPEGVGAVPKGVRSSLWPAHVHAAALRADGTAVCWGRNTDGECNAPPGVFRQIAAGGEYRGFTIGLRPDGTLESWGYNENGERNVPSTTVTQMVVGIYHGIGMLADPCPGDITNNGVVDAVDLAAILTSWGTVGGGEFDADANRDGMVDAQDLALVLGSWGACPG